jgi:hypothetical protein
MNFLLEIEMETSTNPCDKANDAVRSLGFAALLFAVARG